jgi:hypothetical protein
MSRCTLRHRRRSVPEESIHASCGARSGQHKPLFQVLDGHASDERPGTAAKSSGLKVIKVARCTRA